MTDISLPISSPHAHGGRSVAKVMGIVILALLPATAIGFWQFGWPAFFLWAVTVASCLATEAAWQRLAGAPAFESLADGSALLTGCLLAMSLPPWAPWWVGVVGGVFAMAIGKHIFGGLGQNVFNPAMVGRVMLLVSFPVPMTQWLAPAGAQSPSFIDSLTITFFGGGVPDAMASASLLGHVKTEASRGISLLQSLGNFSFPDASLGLRAGSMGETAALALLIGGLALVALRIIPKRLPIAFFLGLAVPAALAHATTPQIYLSAPVHLLSGGAMLGAFFIVTDYVSSPSTPRGQWLYGLGCGALTWVIRTWGGYPEGLAFAVLLMNALTPLIDRWTRPRIFGRRRSGESLAATREGAQ